MAQRTVCLCDGKYIGIESIYTVINGEKINIPEKLQELRVKSRNNELFCPCGCGANLTLVAGEKNKKEQHFRMMEGTYKNECRAVIENETSIDSKITLRCWLDDKLKTDDIDMRVPINFIDDTNRKYEFSFLSRTKNVAISYNYNRANLSDEKFDILEINSEGIQLVYIVDIMNGGCTGQYPESLMKIQSRQGYCLFLEMKEKFYSDAKMHVVFYAQDVNGLWQEIKVIDGQLSDYKIAENGHLYFKDKLVSSLSDAKKQEFRNLMQTEKVRYEEEKKRQEEEQKRIREELEKQKEEEMLRQEKEKVERKHREDDFFRNLAENFTQQETRVLDADGNRWIKCEYCGLIDKESEFVSYGGLGHKNLGICRACSSKSELQKMPVVSVTENNPIPIKYDESICPVCGAKLVLRTAKKGNNAGNQFLGCSAFPKCRYTKNT